MNSESVPIWLHAAQPGVAVADGAYTFIDWFIWPGAPRLVPCQSGASEM